MQLLIGDIIELIDKNKSLFETDEPEKLSIELIDNKHVRYSLNIENDKIIIRVTSGSRHLKIKPIASNSVEIDSEY